jgi:hypothetical protein
MDFIETIFHVSPDGGSGSTEAIVVSVFVAAVLAFVLRQPFAQFVRQRIISVIPRIQVVRNDLTARLF